MKPLAFMLACFLAFGFSKAQTQNRLDNSTPEKAVEAFIAALNAKDVKTLMNLVQNAQDKDNYIGPFVQATANGNGFSGSDFHTIVSGNEAVVVFILHDDRTEKAFTAEDLVRLVQTDHGWLLAQPNADQVTSVAGLSVFALALSRPKALESSVALNQRVMCAQNVRQCGLAMIMYAADYDDVMKVPPAQAEVRKALAPYLKNDDLWKCPTTNQIAYSFNVNLAGKSFTSVDNPVNTVMFYEGSKGKLDFRHDGIANVCFCDGHVKALNADQAKSILWK